MPHAKQFPCIAYFRSDSVFELAVVDSSVRHGLGGCTRDRKILKQEFRKEGNLAFEQGKYPDASILSGRSLPEDPRFAEATASPRLPR
jgi:hypothetical protein